MAVHSQLDLAVKREFRIDAQGEPPDLKQRQLEPSPATAPALLLPTRCEGAVSDLSHPRVRKVGRVAVSADAPHVTVVLPARSATICAPELPPPTTTTRRPSNSVGDS